MRSAFGPARGAAAGRTGLRPAAAKTAIAAALVAALLAAAATVRAGAVPGSPPAPQPLRELRFPPFAERTLGNGLRLIAIERHTDPEVSLRLLLPAGALHEPRAKAGLAGATADLLTQGTAGRTAQQIAYAIDSVGGRLDASSGADFTSVSAAVTADQLDLAIELLADVVLHPSFPPGELERWRRQSLSSLELARANPAYLANVAFQRLVYGAHPYGSPARGTPESIRGLTRDDVAAFHREHYRPGGAILAVVGDFRPAPALAAIERAFGGWAGGATPATPTSRALELPAHARRQVLVVDKPDAVQTQIRVGQAALAYDDPDFFPAEVYGTMLGGGSFARLFQEIRVKRGLAYGAYCRFAKQLVGGSFAVSTSTKTASTVEALRVALEEVARMGAAPPPPAELEEAKAYLNGAFPLEIESAGDVANRVLDALAHGRDRAFLDTYRDRISAVTGADVQRFGRTRIHADRSVVVLVGNAAAFGPELAKQLGPFTTIPAAELDPLAPDLRRPAAAAPAPGPARTPAAPRPSSPPAPPSSGGAAGG